MSEEKRATREEIFFHLQKLLGVEAVNVALRVQKLALEKRYEESLLCLKEYDATLGV